VSGVPLPMVHPADLLLAQLTKTEECQRQRRDCDHGGNRDHHVSAMVHVSDPERNRYVRRRWRRFAGVEFSAKQGATADQGSILVPKVYFAEKSS
jgi:hypothetical protein